MVPPPRQYAAVAPMGVHQVTEDTPADMLEGMMDLQVTLPSGKRIFMSVDRGTPMMDLLVQITTNHRITPGDHVIRVLSDNRYRAYKPSTPIGNLDTSAIEIVSKNSINGTDDRYNHEQMMQEQNMRLKPKEWVYKTQLLVNLPQNQLAVYRVQPKTSISDILTMICDDKNLDLENHEIRHPLNIDERLRGSCSLSDYQLQEVCVVSRDFRAPPLSVTDLITMASIAHQNDSKRRGFRAFFSRKSKSSTGDSSISSGSAGDRSISPARSDESTENNSRPLSPASSTAALPEPTTVKHRKHERRLPRPSSLLSLARGKKRPAPRPPANGVANGKGTSHSSKSSIDLRASPSQDLVKENGQARPTKSNGQHVPTNLTSALSKSTPTLVPAKGKRKAPPPPPPVIPRTEPETLINEVILEESPASKRRSSSETTDDTSESPSEDVIRDKNGTAESPESERKFVITDSETVPSIEPLEPSESSTSFTNSPEPRVDSPISSNSSHSSIDTPEPVVKEDLQKTPVEAKNAVVAISNIAAQDPTSSNEPHSADSAPLIAPASSCSPPDLVVDLHLSNVSSGRLDATPDDTQQNVRIVSQESEQPLKSILKKRHKNHHNHQNSEDFPVHKAKIPEDYEYSSDEDLLPSEALSQLKIESSCTSESRKIQAVFDENFAVEIQSQFPSEEVSTQTHDKKIHFTSSNDEEKKDNHDTISAVGSQTDTSEEPAVPYSESIRSLSCEVDAQLILEDASSSSTPNGNRDRSSSSSTSDNGDFEDLKIPSDTLCEAFNVDLEERENASPTHSTTPISSDSVQESITEQSFSESQEEVKDHEHSISEIETLVEELKQSPNYNNSSNLKTWTEVEASNYNVVLSMTPDSVTKRSGSISTTNSFQSLVNTSFNEGQELKTSRSGTESSYESAPPPLPETPMPDTDVDEVRSVFSNVSFSSADQRIETLSRQSSISDLSSRGDDRPRAAFSISTYTNRAQEVSYDKKLLRSESYQDISKPQQIEELEAKRNKLTESSSVIQNTNKTKSLERSNSTYGMNRVEEIKAQIEQNTDKPKVQRRPWSSMDTWRNKTEKPQVPPKKFKEYQKYSCTGDRPKSMHTGHEASNLRKAKSTADIRVSGVKDNPEKDLDQDYMKLQDDFLKWQQQLLQNQSLLHNRVVPIAANPPTLSSTGATRGLKLSWKPRKQVPIMRNMMMQMPNQPSMPASSEPHKPREINIPIRFEDDDSEPSPAPASNIQVNHRSQPLRQSQPSSGNWNSNAPAWDNRPTNVECVIVNEPPPVFQAPNDPSFMPIFFSKERAGGPTQSFQRPQQTFQEPQQNFGAQQRFSSAPSFSQPTSTGYDMQRSTQSQYQQQYQQPQQSYQPAQQSFEQPPQSYSQPPQQYQQPPPPQQYQQQYQQPSQQQYQPPQQTYQQPPQQFQPTFDSRMPQQNQNYMPQQQQSYGHPKNSYNNGPSAGEEDLSNRFKSVVTLSNDMPSPSIINSRPEPYKQGPRGYQQPEPSKPFHSKIISNAIKSQAAPSENKQTPPPVAPVSSRLVQAVKQPSPEAEMPPVAPPKREKKKSLSPVTKEPSPPFVNVSMRPVEQRVSPPKATYVQPPEPMTDAPAPPPPPPPVAPVPPPPPANLGERRTSTGKKIISSDKPQELDAREELMMAIRSFGGAGHLRKTGIRDLEQ